MSVIDTPLTLPSKVFETDQKQHRANAKSLEDFAVTVITQVVPVGAILPYAGITPPSGWLYCNGAAISRANYATLFQIIGTVFGVGDGSSTFNLPKMDSNSATDMTVPVGAGIGVLLGTRVNLSDVAGTVVKGGVVNFIIKT